VARCPIALSKSNRAHRAANITVIKTAAATVCSFDPLNVSFLLLVFFFEQGAEGGTPLAALLLRLRRLLPPKQAAAALRSSVLLPALPGRAVALSSAVDTLPGICLDQRVDAGDRRPDAIGIGLLRDLHEGADCIRVLRQILAVG